MSQRRGVKRAGSIGWEAGRRARQSGGEGHESAARASVRKTVYAEETHCHLCGRFVDPTLHFLNPGARTLDEVVPVTMGGSGTDRSNVRLAHRECNTARGNMPLEQWFARHHGGGFTTSRRW